MYFKILAIILVFNICCFGLHLSKSSDNLQNSGKSKEAVISEIDSILTRSNNTKTKFEILRNFTDSKEFQKLSFYTRLVYTKMLIKESPLPETDSIIVLNKLNVGLYNGYMGNYDISLILLNDILKQTSTSHYWEIYAEALSAVSNIYNFQNDNIKTLFYGTKLLEKSIELNDFNYEYVAHLFMGDYYRKIGLEWKSIPHYFRADEIAELQNDSNKLDRTKSKIGKLLHLADEDSLSVVYHKTALLHAEKINNKKRINYLKYIISLYSETDSFEEKIKHLENYLNNINKDNHLADASRTYAFIAEFNFELNRFEKAFLNSQLSLSYGLKGNNYDHIFNSYFTMSKVKFEIAEMDSSLHYLGLAKTYLRENESAKLAFKHYEFASKLYKKLGKYEQALLLHEESIKHYKIANDVKTKKKLAINFARYKFEKEKEKEIAIERNSSKTKISERNYAILSLFGLSITILLALFYTRKISNERNQNLKKVQEKNKVIENQKNELTELNRMKNKFFSVIAHDLRGPIGNMTRLSKLILMTSQQKEDEENVKIASLLSSSSKNVQLLLQSLLLWGKVQMKVAEPNKSEYYIQSRVAEILKIYEDSIISKHITLKISIDESHILFVDEGMIDAVFRNLIHNAIKFTSDNGFIELKSYFDKNAICVNVIDDGIGIAKEKITEFLNESNLHHNSNNKSGLGLILAKEFIELNGGKMVIESELGKGTNVKFSLPKFQKQ